MNEKTARQIAEMKNQTIGVEVEMNSITRQKAAKVAAAYFGTGRYENTAGRNGYSTWSAWDAQGREWKFQKDVSIAGPDEQKCELVTPILTYGDIETLQELCRQLRHAGAKSDASRGCGVHIHIGRRATPAEPSEPRQHHGEPRKPDRRSSEARPRPHEPLLPHGRPQVLRAGQPQEAPHDGPACGHLVHQQRRKLRQKPPLQRQPLPYAQPPRHLYQRDGRV